MIEGKQKPARAPASKPPARPRLRARHFVEPGSPVVARALLAEIAADRSAFFPVAPRQPLVLYGAGNLGRLARDHLRAVGEDFTLVVDRNAENLARDLAWQGVELRHPDHVDADLKRDAMLAVSIATSPYAPLEMALQAAGWSTIVPFYDIAENFRDRHPLSNGWFAAPFTGQDIEALDVVLDSWADDRSRAHHLQFIAWRRLRQEWSFDDAPVTIDDRFFIPEILHLLHEREVFVDAGAHTGSVTQRFIGATHGRFADIVALEPDPASRAEMERMVSRLPWCQEVRVDIRDVLLDSAPGMVAFHGGLGYASQISTTGAETRAAVTLDSLDLSPTYLKLHLEGAELPALKGAVETLHRHRPIVAATVYHNADGLHATARWMMDTLTDYDFLFRLHSWCGTGAVVYALPKERRT